MDEFIGQKFLKSNLKAYIESSKKEKKLNHIIFMDPGLGKTSLAHIISNEKMLIFIQRQDQLSQKRGFKTLLSNLMEGDILFIDEITDCLQLLKKHYTLQWKTLNDYVIGSGHRLELFKFQ